MLFDIHNDIVTTKLPLKAKRKIVDRASAELDGMVSVYWATKGSGFPEKLAVKKRANIYNAIEDMWFYQPSDYEKLAEFNPLYCSLTWNGDNPLAGGAGGTSGLMKEGRVAIDHLNELNIPVDTAHLNRKSFFEVVDRSARVLNSHTCLDSLYAHERNLTDEQARLIVNRGGIVGLTLVSSFMTKNHADINDYFLQIDTFVNKFGIDYVAIGTDFYGTADLPTGLKEYYDFYALEYALLGNGYKRRDIDKLFFQNVRRFFGLPIKKA